MPSLFDLLNQPSQANGLAPLPTGNLGAGSQPLELGSLVAQNSAIDPNLKNSLRQAFGYSAPTPSQPPQRPTPQPTVDPYTNFANKATGQQYK